MGAELGFTGSTEFDEAVRPNPLGLGVREIATFPGVGELSGCRKDSTKVRNLVTVGFFLDFSYVSCVRTTIIPFLFFLATILLPSRPHPSSWAAL